MQTYGDLNTMSCVANSYIIFCNDENLWAIFKEKDDLHGVYISKNSLCIETAKNSMLMLNGFRFKAEGISKK